jgi:hypothetical protein
MKWSYIAHRYHGEEGSPTANPRGFEFALGDGETARQYRFARTMSAPSWCRASRRSVGGSPRLPSTKAASSWISASWRGEALALAAETSRATPATKAVRCVCGLVIECLQHGGGRRVAWLSGGRQLLLPGRRGSGRRTQPSPGSPTSKSGMTQSPVLAREPRSPPERAPAFSRRVVS